MKLIAIPIVGGVLSPHFGHCEHFKVYHIDKENNIVKEERLTPPPHAPGVLPKWLSENKINIIIAGGMGNRAQNLFKQNNIEVNVGSPSLAPEKIIEQYLNGSLILGQNACDH